jgi:hypothetical protein
MNSRAEVGKVTPVPASLDPTEGDLRVAGLFPLMNAMPD